MKESHLNSILNFKKGDIITRITPKEKGVDYMDRFIGKKIELIEVRKSEAIGHTIYFKIKILDNSEKGCDSWDFHCIDSEDSTTNNWIDYSRIG